MKLSRRRKAILVAVSAAVVVGLTAIVGRPAFHLLRTGWSDEERRGPVPPGHADDASRLDLTSVALTWDIPADPAQAETQLAALLQRAQRDGLKVSIAGARHSMGGHTIYPGGVVINMRPFSRMHYDARHEILRAGAGALWSDAIAFLNPLGRSIAVMQSFSSFSIGGSVSVNAHGWQFREPPIGSSVESMRVMLADGTVVRCSRAENAELFSLAIGGYGLVGVILEVDLRTVPDDRYRIERMVVAVASYESILRTKTAEADAAMEYGRLDVSARDFLKKAILNVFHRVAPEKGRIPVLDGSALNGLRRAVFRGSVGSEYGKVLRWNAETLLEEHMASALLYRNQILADDVALYEDRSAGSTEILQEYFLPEGRMEAFLADARAVVGAGGSDLLNVTVRNVKQDHDSLLRYADRDMVALVFLFHQARTAEADAAMEPVTRRLIDAALAQGGRYYLPYRLHATKEQFLAAYPQAARFFDLKRKYDPGETFQNQFYLTYGK